MYICEEIFDNIFSFLPTHEELFKILPNVNLKYIVKEMVFKDRDKRSITKNSDKMLKKREGSLLVEYIENFRNLNKIYIYYDIDMTENDIDRIFTNNKQLKEIYYPSLQNIEIIKRISKYAKIYTNFLNYEMEKKFNFNPLNDNHKFKMSNSNYTYIEDNIKNNKINLNLIKSDEDLMYSFYDLQTTTSIYLKIIDDIPYHCVNKYLTKTQCVINIISDIDYIKLIHIFFGKFDIVKFFNNIENRNVIINNLNKFVYVTKNTRKLIGDKKYKNNKYNNFIIPYLSLYLLLNDKINYKNNINCTYIDNTIHNFDFEKLNKRYMYYNSFKHYVEYIIELGYNINRIDKETIKLIGL